MLSVCKEFSISYPKRNNKICKCKGYAFLYLDFKTMQIHSTMLEIFRELHLCISTNRLRFPEDRSGRIIKPFATTMQMLNILMFQSCRCPKVPNFNWIAHTNSYKFIKDIYIKIVELPNLARNYFFLLSFPGFPPLISLLSNKLRWNTGM